MTQAQHAAPKTKAQKNKLRRKRLLENRLGEILMDYGIITPEDLHEALIDQAETKEPLGTILIRHGVINERILEKTLRRQYYKKIAFLAAIFFACYLCF